jgi:nucleotide-binding universal stress UspA family protein
MGALNQNLYSIIVTMAVLTTAAMPPTLRWALSRVPLRPGEKQRLEREAFEAKGFVANMERLLLMVSDSPNGRLASRLAGLLAGPRGLPTTVLHVDPGPGSSEKGTTAAKSGEIVDDVKQSANQSRSAQPASVKDGPPVAIKASAELSDPEQAVSREAPKGYDLLIVGLDYAMPGGGFNPKISKAARAYEGPSAVVVARGAHDDDPIGGPIKILTPITGTAISRRAAEISIEIARATDAEMTVLYVSPSKTSPDRLPQRRPFVARRHAESVLKEIVEIADHYEVRLRTKIKISDKPYAAILDESDRSHETLIVLGVAARPSEALVFGNTADQLLETSRSSLLFVAS